MSHCTFLNGLCWTGKVEEEDMEVFGGRQPLTCATVDRCPRSCVSGVGSAERIVEQDANFEMAEVFPNACRDRTGDITEN